MTMKDEFWLGKILPQKSGISFNLKAFGERFWSAFALVTLSTITVAAIFWILDHPYGTNWDEARYINRAYRDVAFVHEGGIGQFIKGVITEDRSRPPAYRLIALPFTLLLGVNSTIVRLISLTSLWVSLAFIYLAARRIAGATAGAFAVAFLAVCPIIIGGNMRFYVDYPFYLAIAALLYFLLRDWNKEEASTFSWIGFGLALAIGWLAKPPILFVSAPMILLTLFFSWRKIIVNPKFDWLVKAAGLALVINLPWWIFNFKPAFAKAFRSGKFVRHSLGEKGSVEAISHWLYAFCQSVVGPGLILLTLAIIATFAFKLFRKQMQIDTTTATAIAICLAGGLPMLLLSANGTNQNLRLVAPTLLPLAVAIGAIATLTRWTTSKWLATIATAVLTYQLIVIVSPTPGEPRYQKGDTVSQQLLWGNATIAMRRVEQWDWSKLREVLKENQIEKPLIGYLGNSGSFNPPTIALPWVKANEEVKVRWLWQYTFGEINWDKVIASAKTSDVVLTTPTLVGSKSDRQDLDNQHNAEFVQRMQKLSEFSAPIKLTVGKYEPMEIFVFLNKQPRTPNSPPPTDTLDLF